MEEFGRERHAQTRLLCVLLCCSSGELVVGRGWQVGCRRCSSHYRNTANSTFLLYIFSFDSDVCWRKQLPFTNTLPSPSNFLTFSPPPVRPLAKKTNVTQHPPSPPSYESMPCAPPVHQGQSSRWRLIIGMMHATRS